MDMDLDKQGLVRKTWRVCARMGMGVWVGGVLSLCVRVYVRVCDCHIR